MYREDYFYGISDIMHHNVYASLLGDNIIKEERGIIKIFKNNDEVIVMEYLNGKDEIIKDTRIDKNNDIVNYDLVFLKSIERYYSDYEIKGMIYEYVEDIGAWYRVKIDGYDPLDKRLKKFYLKKKINKEDLINCSNSKEELKYLEKFYDIKGLVKFTKPKEVEEFFKKVY